MKLSTEDRVIGGVCGGIAESSGISSILIRLGFIIATLMGVGLPVIVYIILWLSMSRDTSK